MSIVSVDACGQLGNRVAELGELLQYRFGGPDDLCQSARSQVHCIIRRVHVGSQQPIERFELLLQFLMPSVRVPFTRGRFLTTGVDALEHSFEAPVEERSKRPRKRAGDPSEAHQERGFYSPSSVETRAPCHFSGDSLSLPAYLTDDRVTLEAVSRRDAQALTVGDRVALCRVLGKYLVYADTEDAGIVPHLCFSGCWESWITLAVARLVRPGWRCLDVGANHGYYTLLMADGAGPTGAVIAVEPNTKPARLLPLTLSVNGLRWVEVVEKAAWDADGERLKLTIPAHFGLNAMLSEWRGEELEAETVEVESTTIDSLTSDWPRIDLIKIDVEGSEEAVWRGMQETLGRNGDVVVILEVNADRYEDPPGFFSEIEGAGFPLRYINNEGDMTATSVDELATRRLGQDWMLFLQR